MNTVSKNIKRLRKQDNISQEVLAERLNVTRQAVSNWETGRTQPDVDMLLSVAAAFGTDISDVIYGEKRPAESYPEDRKKRIVTVAVYVTLLLLLLALELFLKPSLIYQEKHYYKVFPYWIYKLICSPLQYICFVFLLFGVISIWKDIRIRNVKIRRAFLITGAILMIGYIVFAISIFYFTNIISFFILKTIKVPAIFAIPGIMLYMGSNI